MTKFQYGLGLILSFLGVSPATMAQYNVPQSKVWAVGGKKGIDFNTSPSTIINTGLTNANEGSASVSNEHGVFQFCTNGTNVWNAQGILMPNGTNINGSGLNTVSTTQSSVIVPIPNNQNRYLVFSLTPVSNCRLFANVIDMSLDNGNGDIDTTFHWRRTVLKNGLTEKMTVAKGCNNDIWLLVHGNSSPTFFSYHITDNGLDTNAVISHVGDLPGLAYNQGVMKVSPDGRKVMTNTFSVGGQNIGTEIYDFDPATGVVTNAQLIDVINAYGGTFSPKGKLLYLQEISSPGRVYQYDLDRIGQPEAKTFLGNSGQYCDMKLAPDGKIYVASNINSMGFNSYRYFARINQPDLIGLACQFQDTVTELSFAAATGNNGILTQGLPNDVVVATPARVSASVVMDSLFCNQLDWEVSLEIPESAQNRSWNISSNESQLQVREAGEYIASYFYNCTHYSDTFKIQSSFIESPIISIEQGVLQVQQPYFHIEWYKEGVLLSNASTFSIEESGEYQVIVRNEEGCEAESSLRIESGLSILNVKEMNVKVFPNPTQSGQIMIETNQLGTVIFLDLSGKKVLEVRMENRSEIIDISNFHSGTYFIQFDKEGQVSQYSKLIKY